MRFGGSWYADAACRGRSVDLWFDDSRRAADAARRVCDDCKVATACLEYALDNEIRFGVWGGKSGNQRQRIVGRRARLAAFTDGSR